MGKITISSAPKKVKAIEPRVHRYLQGSSDDNAWIALARAEVKAWEQDPAIGHERLRWACDAYRHSIDLLKPGFVQVSTMSDTKMQPSQQWFHGW